MDDNNIKSNGELNGFDSADEAKPQEAEQGYTVTPDGGFYTKQKSDIIQDEVVKPQEPQASEPYNTNNKGDCNQSPKTDYFPSGQYSAYSYAHRNQESGATPYQEPPRVKIPKMKNKAKKRYGAGIIITAALLAAVIGTGGGVIASNLFKDEMNATPINPSTVSGSNVNINIDETAESVVEAVADKVSPSVVGIRTTTSVQSFFGGSNSSTGEGSGVVYSADGYIITNYHVIAGAVSNKSGSKIEVFFESTSDDSYEASVVGYDVSCDLAVIKIKATNLIPAEIADSSALKVGQYVITVGNPGGLEFMDSVTYGVISGLNRVVSANSKVALIQTDAAINPGNSGGALVNTKGQLVGINSSKIVAQEYEGMGFAIPSNKAIEICKKIISNENNPEPYTGITISEKYTAEVLEYYGYPVGSVILSVAEGSPAEDAGLAKGDIITEFNGTEIKEFDMVDELLKECKPKQEIKVKIYRSGRYYTTTITIGSNNAVG